MKRGGPLKRYTRLSYRSKRREEEAAARRVVVGLALIRDKRECRARSVVREVDCRGPLDPHEVIPRSAWRAGYLELSNVVIVCRAHHDWIGENPTAAHGFGLHGYSWERPPDEPGRENGSISTKEEHDGPHHGATGRS